MFYLGPNPGFLYGGGGGGVKVNKKVWRRHIWGSVWEGATPSQAPKISNIFGEGGGATKF